MYSRDRRALRRRTTLNDTFLWYGDLYQVFKSVPLLLRERRRCGQRAVLKILTAQVILTALCASLLSHRLTTMADPHKSRLLLLNTFTNNSLQASLAFTGEYGEHARKYKLRKSDLPNWQSPTHKDATSTTAQNNGIQFVPGSFLDKCSLEANRNNIQTYETSWSTNRLPVLSTVVLTTPVATTTADSHDKTVPRWHAIFNTRHLKIDPARVGRKRPRGPRIPPLVWKCDGQAATIVGKGCPNGDALAVQCPQDANSPIHNMTATTIRNITFTYRLFEHIQCNRKINKSWQNQRNTNKTRVAMGSILLGQTARLPHRIVEWIEYHRMIGVDHFFLHLLAEYNHTADQHLFPNLPYVTYIPFNVMSTMNLDDDVVRVFRFQVPSQVDTIYRARAMGFDWVVMNDVDEYVHIKHNEMNQSLPKTLDFLLSEYQQQPEHQETIAGISIRSYSFGSCRQMDPNEPYPELMIDYNCSRRGAFLGKRMKSAVRPQWVSYYSVHGVTDPPKSEVTANVGSELRLLHYKDPEKGTFESRKPKKDTTLRDMYRDRLVQRLQLIWEKMRTEYQSPLHLWKASLEIHSGIEKRGRRWEDRKDSYLSQSQIVSDSY